MLGSVKIYGKKEVTLPKKGPNTKTTSWKVIAHVVLVSMNMAIYFLAPRVGYFAHMDLKQKWKSGLRFVEKKFMCPQKCF